MNIYQKDIMDRFNMPADAFFQRYSDMYVGCESYEKAVMVRQGGAWKSMAEIFKPNKGSDMERFPYAVDIPFAYLHEHIAAKAPK